MTDCPDLIVKRGKSAGLGADLVCSDSANGVNDPCIVAKAVDFFPGAVNPEFAIGLDQGCTPKVEGSQGSLEQCWFGAQIVPRRKMSDPDICS